MKNYKILVGCVVLAVFGLYGLIFGAQAWPGRINGQLRVTLDENHGFKAQGRMGHVQRGEFPHLSVQQKDRERSTSSWRAGMSGDSNRGRFDRDRSLP